MLAGVVPSGTTDGWSRHHLPVPVWDRLGDMPAEFGPWQTIWKRHRRNSGDGTWDKILPGCSRKLTPEAKWIGRSQSTRR